MWPGLEKWAVKARRPSEVGSTHTTATAHGPLARPAACKPAAPAKVPWRGCPLKSPAWKARLAGAQQGRRLLVGWRPKALAAAPLFTISPPLATTTRIGGVPGISAVHATPPIRGAGQLAIAA